MPTSASIIKFMPSPLYVPVASHRVGAVVLCGGLSTRMGSAKAQLLFGSETLLERTLRIVRCVADTIVISAAAEQALPKSTSRAVVVRDVEPRQGPLQGLALGMAALPSDVEWTFVCGCDLPLLSASFVAGLLRLAETPPSPFTSHSIDAAIHRDNAGYWRPLPAMLRRRACDVARQLFASGERRLSALTDRLTVRAVSTAEITLLDPSGMSLLNANTPDDYRRALSLAGLGTTARER